MPMDSTEMEHRLTKIEEQSAHNAERMTVLESDNQVLHELAKSVAVLAEKMNTMDDNLDEMAESLKAIKEKPGKRWDSAIDKIIAAVIGGILTYALSVIF